MGQYRPGFTGLSHMSLLLHVPIKWEHEGSVASWDPIKDGTSRVSDRPASTQTSSNPETIDNTTFCFVSVCLSFDEETGFKCCRQFASERPSKVRLKPILYSLFSRSLFRSDVLTINVEHCCSAFELEAWLCTVVTEPKLNVCRCYCCVTRYAYFESAWLAI